MNTDRSIHTSLPQAPNDWHRAALILTVALLLTMGLYALLVVAPFFAYGLHLQDAAQVAGGMFDPKGFPLFQGSGASGNWLNALALVSLIALPVGAVGAGGLLIVSLRRAWPRLGRQARIVASMVLGLAAILMLVYFSPLGRLIGTWLVD